MEIQDINSPTAKDRGIPVVRPHKKATPEASSSKQPTDDKEKSYSCKWCVRKFSVRWYLARHERHHTKEKPFKCEVCDRRFANKQNAQIHFDSFHPGSNPPALDKRTGVALVSESERKAEPASSGENPQKCKCCDEVFRERWKMVRHVRVHTKEKPYECQVCDMKFTLSSSVRKHERRVHKFHGKLD